MLALPINRHGHGLPSSIIVVSSLAGLDGSSMTIHDPRHVHPLCIGLLPWAIPTRLPFSARWASLRGIHHQAVSSIGARRSELILMADSINQLCQRPTRTGHVFSAPVLDPQSRNRWRTNLLGLSLRPGWCGCVTNPGPAPFGPAKGSRPLDLFCDYCGGPHRHSCALSRCRALTHHFAVLGIHAQPPTTRVGQLATNYCLIVDPRVLSQ